MGASEPKRMYTAGDRLLKLSENAVRYPISSYLTRNMTSRDDIKIVLITKKNNYSEKNITDVKNEIKEINKDINANVEIKEVYELTDSSLLLRTTLNTILEEIDEDCLLYADLTFADQTDMMLAMSAISIAEKQLGAIIEKIMYGSATGTDTGVAKDITSFYLLQTIAGGICRENTDEARQVLKELLTM